MSSTDEEEDATADGACDDDSCAGDLQEYLEDASQVEPNNKVQYVINLCFVYLPDFSTDVHPFNHKKFKHSKKKHKMSKNILTSYIKRKDPTTKLSNKKIPDLITILQTDAFSLSGKDLEYLKRQLQEYKDKCQATIDEPSPATVDTTSPSSDSRANITVDDRLRLIEAMLCDESKEKLASSQECLSKEQLDARNSIQAIEDYFETVSNVFNNPESNLSLTVYPDLHPELSEPRDLLLKEYRTTRAKVKDISSFFY